MAVKNFRVCFECRGERLATILGLLSQEVSNLNVTQVGAGAATTVTLPNKGKPTPPSQTRGGKVALSIFSPGKVIKTEDSERAFAAAGFKPDSASPMLSKLSREGVLVRVAKGQYKLA